jgi:hypothetical protein
MDFHGYDLAFVRSSERFFRGQKYKRLKLGGGQAYDRSND